jgi:hypothetical protein
VIPSPILSPRPFTAEDLTSIVLGLATGRPAPIRVAVLDRPDDRPVRLRPGGDHRAPPGPVCIGHDSLFAPRGLLEHDAPPAEPGAIFVQGIAGVFETAAGADSSLRRYVANLRAFQLRDEVRIAAGGLGDSSEGLRGRSDGEDVTVYAWRTATSSWS